MQVFIVNVHDIDDNADISVVLTDENKDTFESVQNSSSPRKTQHGVKHTGKVRTLGDFVKTGMSIHPYHLV